MTASLSVTEADRRTSDLRRMGAAVATGFGTRTARVGGALIVAHLALVALALLWHPDATAISDRIFSSPSRDHPFGTDELGRDVFNRVVVGAPYVLGISLAGAISSTVLGSLFGASSALRGGHFEALLMRVIDVLLSFPTILIALLAAALFPPGYVSIFAVVTVIYVPQVTRVARTIFATTLATDYAAASRLRGERATSIIAREALPNAVAPLLVEFALRWNYSVILIASLNFLGVGVQPPTPDWGLMLYEARTQLLVAPWVSVAPAVALATLAVGINFVADGFSAAVAQRTGRAWQTL